MKTRPYLKLIVSLLLETSFIGAIDTLITAKDRSEESPFYFAALKPIYPENAEFQFPYGIPISKEGGNLPRELIHNGHHEVQWGPTRAVVRFVVIGTEVYALRRNNIQGWGNVVDAKVLIGHLDGEPFNMDNGSYILVNPADHVIAPGRSSKEDVWAFSGIAQRVKFLSTIRPTLINPSGRQNEVLDTESGIRITLSTEDGADPFQPLEAAQFRKLNYIRDAFPFVWVRKSTDATSTKSDLLPDPLPDRLAFFKDTSGLQYRLRGLSEKHLFDWSRITAAKRIMIRFPDIFSDRPWIVFASLAEDLDPRRVNAKTTAGPEVGIAFSTPNERDLFASVIEMLETKYLALFVANGDLAKSVRFYELSPEVKIVKADDVSVVLRTPSGNESPAIVPLLTLIAGAKPRILGVPLPRWALGTPEKFVQAGVDQLARKPPLLESGSCPQNLKNLRLDSIAPLLRLRHPE
jgi:hypothetical protein